MGKIIQTAHNYCSLDKANEFYNNVNTLINLMQNAGLKVEIQYQQSNGFFSAFIIGREDNSSPNFNHNIQINCETDIDKVCDEIVEKINKEIANT